jgi:uncharacterized protein (TIGR02147 family)
MPNIAEYTDYRRFLKDYYDEAKHANPGFSYQVFSERAGIKSKGYLHNVIRGERTLDTAAVLGLARAMKLSKRETEYFENLVGMHNARTLAERNHFFERLSSIRIRGDSAWEPQLVRHDQYELYARLHYSVVRSLIDLLPVTDDYARLARNVRPSITPSQAKKAVELLLRLGWCGVATMVCWSRRTRRSPPRRRWLRWR